MTSFATEFHGTPEELIELTGKWMADYPIIATAEERIALEPPGPFWRMLPVTRENFREILALPCVSEVLFTENPVNPSLSCVSDILTQEQPGALCLHIYRVGPNGLAQARLTTMDANPMWKKMNSELKKMTTAGATLLYKDGDTTFNRNVRFTAGAKALAAAGVPLRASEQSTRFKYLPK